jgi:hypothetical protein
MTQDEARREVFETAAALADALMAPGGRWAWEPLRDLVLAGLEAGGLRSGADAESLRRAAGELAAAALEARRSMPSRHAMV